MDAQQKTHGHPHPPGFTMVEMLVSLAGLILLLSVLFSVVGQMITGLGSISKKIDSSAMNRAAFESLHRDLGDSAMNTYWDYFNSNLTARNAFAGALKDFVPAYYGRNSDLHFQIGNAAQLGLTGWEMIGHGVFFQMPRPGQTGEPRDALGAAGYFVGYGLDPSFPALPGLTQRPAFHLFQWAQVPADLAVESQSGRVASDWITLDASETLPVASSVVAMLIRTPEVDPVTADSYFWDSRKAWESGSQPAQGHQLPPFIEITLISANDQDLARWLDGITSAAAAYAALGLPSPGSLFMNPADYEKDLATVSDALDLKKVRYQIATQKISLPASQWSP